MKALNLFPLTVAQDKIVIDENERRLLVDEIVHMQESNNKNSVYAWTGDTKGFQFLFSNKKFNSLSSKISASLIKYLNILEINTDLLDIFYQRSWATYTDNEESINFHTHSQSNISFAYYLLKPNNSGGIIFKKAIFKQRKSFRVCF